MNQFLVCFISGASFLLSFLLYFHPLQHNIKANKWLGLFVMTIGGAFIGSFLILKNTDSENILLFKFVNTVQFLTAPAFLFSILFFTNPSYKIKKSDWLHFVPFVLYGFFEYTIYYNTTSISVFPLFKLTQDTAFLVRNILPVIMLPYFVAVYYLLKRHQTNLKLIVSNTSQINLEWLIQFLYILFITLFIWLNDAIFGIPYITEATNMIYAICIFFLAYYSIQQKTIFAFKQKDTQEIVDLFKNAQSDPLPGVPEQDEGAEPVSSEKSKFRLLTDTQLENLTLQLSSLMEQEKIFLDNDLNLSIIAKKLGISIHEASFLINKTTKDNFYNYVNKFRVEEAKRLLSSKKMEELNILGIAFASGFNSKTTFNTTFKKYVGISPTQYSKEQKNKE